MGTLKIPRPAPPFGVDCEVRKLPMPPLPPPTSPAAPASGWLVVFSVLTPKLERPSARKSPSICTVAAEIRTGWSPATTKRAPVWISKRLTRRGPSVAVL